MTKNIAIITGGISSERPVALRSAENMENWVKISGHTVSVFDFPKDIDIFLSQYKMYDLVIPVLHGIYGEDGSITGMCRTLGVRVAGCTHDIHALCMNKFYTSSVVEKIGIKIPKSWVPGIPMPPKLLPAEGVEELEKSIIVKPNQGGSSIATSKVNTLEGMKMGIKSIEETMKSLSKEQKNLLEENSVQQFVRYFPDQTDSPIIQECIEGREFTVGVYRDYHGFDSLPIMEIKPLKQAFFDYEEKYESDGSNEVFLEGEEDIQKILRTESLLIAEFLDIRGVVRIDWRYDGKDFYFLEVNTIPGFTSASFIPKMWKKAGKTEKEFVEMMMI